MNNNAIKSRDIDLDGAGIIYPYVANRKWNNVYRIEADLRYQVDPCALYRAVRKLRSDYPYFFCTLAKSGKKFVLRETDPDTNTVYNIGKDLCKPFDLKSGEPLIRFLFSSRKIAVEMFHSLTDGHGAMQAMKALLARYQREAFGRKVTENGQNGEDKALLQNRNDIFEELYSAGGKNVSRLISSAYQIKKSPPCDTQYTVLGIPSQQIIRSAHYYGVSVAMLICALQIKAIALSQKNAHGVIRISVPVDLRKKFSFSSCRNSSLYFLVSAKVRETVEFTALLETVKKQFRENLTTENMQNLAYTNVSSAKLKAFKMLPVPVKKAILKFGYSHLGENQFTATMTDIGIIELDDDISRMVQKVYFVLGKQKTKPINIAVTTYDDTVRLAVSYDVDATAFIETMNSLISKYVL